MSVFLFSYFCGAAKEARESEREKGGIVCKTLAGTGTEMVIQFVFCSVVANPFSHSYNEKYTFGCRLDGVCPFTRVE